MLTKKETVRLEAIETAKEIRSMIEDMLAGVPHKEFPAKLHSPAFLEEMADEIEVAILSFTIEAAMLSAHNKKP